MKLLYKNIPPVFLVFFVVRFRTTQQCLRFD